MREVFRDAPLGQIIRLLSKDRFFRYPEEEPGFQIPFDLAPSETSTPTEGDSPASQDRPAKDLDLEKADVDPLSAADPSENDSSAYSDRPAENVDIEKALVDESPSGANRPQPVEADRRSASGSEKSKRSDLERGITAQRSTSRSIKPHVTSEGKILVTWYSEDDPENPQNWSQGKKFWVSMLICIYTFAVYASSSIYVSSEPGIMSHFGVGAFKAELGLALFVLGYGIGPLLFSPMAEIPSLGRNIPYIVTFALFIILSVPTALANNLGGLVFLRFLQGFFGSPCLATGPASMQDIYDAFHVPVGVAFWGFCGFLAPANGPLLSSYAVMHKFWRWSLWEILWMTSFVFIFWFIAMPETSEANILLRRARRLRKATKNENFWSQSELNQKSMKVSDVVRDALIKPMEITFKDPAILFTSVYSGIIYGLYYSFFESFPLVYTGIHHFSLGATGLAFQSITVGVVIGLVFYEFLLFKVIIPDLRKNGPGPQEDVLKLALVFVFGITAAMFGFAWTSRSDIHWIVPCIFVAMFTTSAYLVILGIFAYIQLSYPPYAASLFAGNDFFRSAFAFGFVLFSRGMYLKLGIGKGVSLLAGLSVLGWIGIWIIYFYGAKLRARSKFAVRPDVR